MISTNFFVDPIFKVLRYRQRRETMVLWNKRTRTSCRYNGMCNWSTFSFPRLQLMKYCLYIDLCVYCKQFVAMLEMHRLWWLNKGERNMISYRSLDRSGDRWYWLALTSPLSLVSKGRKRDLIATTFNPPLAPLRSFLRKHFSVSVPKIL